MIYQNRRKTLVDIDLSIWAKVRYFATMQKISVNSALEALLSKALGNCGTYLAQEIGEQKDMMASGENEVPIHMPEATSSQAH
jgi:conjugal transfer/entry exclusion protein